MKKKIKAIWLPEDLATKIKITASKEKLTIIQFITALLKTNDRKTSKER